MNGDLYDAIESVLASDHSCRCDMEHLRVLWLRDRAALLDAPAPSEPRDPATYLTGVSDEECLSDDIAHVAARHPAYVVAPAPSEPGLETEVRALLADADSMASMVKAAAEMSCRPSDGLCLTHNAEWSDATGCEWHQAVIHGLPLYDQNRAAVLALLDAPAPSEPGDAVATFLASIPDDALPDRVGDHYRVVSVCGHCGEAWWKVAAPAPSEPRLRCDIESLRSTAKEQMETGGALASAVFFEGQVYAYDEVLRRLDAPAPSEPRLDAETLAEAMSDAFTYGEPFCDDIEGFWRPFAAKVAARLRGEQR